MLTSFVSPETLCFIVGVCIDVNDGYVIYAPNLARKNGMANYSKKFILS